MSLILTDPPAVSLLVTTCNRPQLIAKAINRILNQTFRNFELIITDASSTRETKKVVLRYNDPRIIYVKADGGIARGRNVGLKHAKGEYIAYCDDDELFYPEHIAKLKEFLDNNREVDLVYCDALHCIEFNKKNFILSHEFDKRKLETTCLFGVGNAMHRKECISKVGFFDENLPICEDWDMWLRIADYFKIAHLPIILHKYIIHGKNVTLQRPEICGEVYEYLIKKRLKGVERNKQKLRDYVSESSFGIIKLFLCHKRLNLASKLTERFYKIIRNYQTIACLGAYHLSKGNFSKALNLFKRSLEGSTQGWRELDSWHIENMLIIMVFLSRTYYQLGNIKMAQDACKEVLKIMPDNIEARIELARCYIKHNLFKKALNVLRPELLEKLHFNIEVENLRGYCYFKMKNYPSAVQELKNAVTLNPHMYISRYNLAMVYFHLGEYAKARDEYQRVLKLEPNRPQAKEMLKLCITKKASSKICN